MAEKKPCVRCQRQIDAFAKSCPYCNWDQANPNVPGPDSQQAAMPSYVPPAERDWKRYVIIGGGGILVLVAAFLVGMWINSDAAPKSAPETLEEKSAEEAVRPAPRANVTLVPMTEADLPITSAPAPNPAEGVPTEYQRTDATAVSSAEYAQLAAQVQAEKKRNAALVDPRSLTGPAYAQAPQRPQTESAPAPAPQRPAREDEQPAMTSASPERREPERREPERREPARVVVTTRPVPISQPLPDIDVRRDVTARLDLKIGSDGRVQEVKLRDTIPGHTPQLIAAVQRWRFKPATENGVPVAAPFSVEISFRASD